MALGLATRVDPDPRQAALDLARSIARRSPHAIRAAKRLLDLAGRVDLEAGFAAEQQEIGDLIGSPTKPRRSPRSSSSARPASPTQADPVMLGPVVLS